MKKMESYDMFVKYLKMYSRNFKFYVELVKLAEQSQRGSSHGMVLIDVEIEKYKVDFLL